MKKFIRSIIACAAITCMAATSVGAATTITPSVKSITSPLSQNAYSFDLTLHVDRDFAGAEFGIKVSDGSIIDEVTLDNGIKSVSSDLVTPQTVKNGVRYFGFTDKVNVFKSGDYKVATIKGTYEGTSPVKVTLESSKIVYIDGTASIGDSSAAPFEVVLSRSSSSSGDSGRSSGGSGSSGKSDPENPPVSTPAKPMQFNDVSPNDWFYNDIKNAYDLKLMNGISENSFSPHAPTQRCMILTILYRLENTPAVKSPAPFSDVATTEYYSDAIAWAVEIGLAKGYSDKTFKPSQPISRQDLAVFLYRYAQYKGYDVSNTAALSKFSDSKNIGDWAISAMSWCNASGIINGTTNTALEPSGNATRAQLAAMFTRFVSKYGK